ncbi:MAG: VWA domain-containing protein [Planctomycetes bacterium]|nr:VWA domain-containing protein [Planctomycetota bacterium]
MNAWKKLACGLLIGYGSLCSPAFADDPVAPPKQEEKKVEKAAKVDIVFVLDTTGSMGGLLEGAKRKIWSIANEVARAKPTPEIRIGLVAYRDKGDAYVTQETDLTDDLDGIYKKLLSFKAGGGGDGPEHVNAGLKAGIEKMTWSTDKDALRIIFLVGDAPPHEDYGDSFDHNSLAKDAITKDIIVNTIRCGGDGATGKVWQEIARKAEGMYVTIDQGGGVAAIATPFDKELADLGDKLGGTRVGYGLRRREMEEKSRDAAESLAAAGDDTKADRAAAMGKAASAPSAGMGGGAWGGDLIAGVESGTVKLADVKDEDLPEDMKKMTPEEREKHVQAKISERAEMRKKIEELDGKRAQFLKDEMAKKGDKDGFDSAVQKAIREQAEKKGIKFEDK